MIVPARLALVLAVSLILVGAGCEDKGCSAASAGPDVCFCPRGASCTHACPGTAPRCALDCAQGNGACAVTCGDNCSAMCQGATSCDATCGANCQIACQYVAQICDVTVGEASVVRCDGAPVCKVACKGACTVDCSDGHCEVTCADPARCDVTCDKAGTTPMLCSDGRTLVCGASCD